jgi:hypothetical protein
MNERIKEIEELCWEELGEDEGMYPVFNTDKFAKLIVREMCSVLDKAQWDKGEDWVCADDTRIIPHIKQHFGVEE